ncbi:MAG: isopentenyl phosphate kinase family protein [Chloroflexi bacterium]|nr:isopentenyl phosphate kinase family protein [Chloroflexota bacterium]
MICYLKLGGSLITDKSSPQTPRLAVLARLAAEIAQASKSRPDLRLVLGHGSGSFGHIEATKYGTRAGVRTPAEWRGYAEVGAVAARLNRIVTDALLQAGVPVVTFQPSASILCNDGKIVEMVVEPILRAVEASIVHLVYGDVAFDRVRGGTIISTEDIFRFLARALRPARILLAGIEDGVYSDWPAGHTVIPAITSENAARYFQGIGESHAPDVTGGMAAKVSEMLGIAAEFPGLETLVFSGEVPGNIFSALTRPLSSFGTIITSHQSPV